MDQTPPENGQQALEARIIQLEQEIAGLHEANQKLTDENRILTEHSRTDALTGLDNRRSFDEETPKALASAIRRGEPVALLYLDLDTLKITNDTIGHSAGDALLRKVAEILLKQIRPGDQVFRFGGDEYAVILPTADTNGAIGVGERIRQAIEVAEIPFEGKYIKVTTSIGVSSFSPPSGINPKENHTELISSTDKQMNTLADQTLYAAKESGRNRTGFLNPEGKIKILGPDPNNPGGKRIQRDYVPKITQ